MSEEEKSYLLCPYCLTFYEENQPHDCQIAEGEALAEERRWIESNKEKSAEEEILERAKPLEDQRNYKTLLQKTITELIKEDIERFGKPKVSLEEYRKIARKEIRKQALREAFPKVGRPEMELYLRTLQSFLSDYDSKLGGTLDRNGKPFFQCPVSPCTFSSNDSGKTWEHFILKHPDEAGKYRRADLLLREGKYDVYKYYHKYPKAEGYYPPMFKVPATGVCPVGYQKVKIQGVFHCVEEKYYAKKKEKLSAMGEEESSKFSNDMVILTALTRNKKEE